MSVREYSKLATISPVNTIKLIDLIGMVLEAIAAKGAVTISKVNIVPKIVPKILLSIFSCNSVIRMIPVKVLNKLYKAQKTN
ncbi:hypothetical protein OAL24_00961 [Oenococcus sicerae]|nr:hypothetical protein OAL24_00961 [Oenococcus sicerae]